MRAAQHGLLRALLRYKPLYNRCLVPFFAEQHHRTVQHLLRKHEDLRSHMVDTQTTRTAPRLRSFNEAVEHAMRAPAPEALRAGFSALKWLSYLQRRLDEHSLTALAGASYRFQVGEVAAIDRCDPCIIAARFPLGLMGDEGEDRGSEAACDDRSPWYLIIVTRRKRNGAMEERHVPESVLRKLSSPTCIGFHPSIPYFFHGYSLQSGAYLPRPTLGGLRSDTEAAPLLPSGHCPAASTTTSTTTTAAGVEPIATPVATATLSNKEEPPKCVVGCDVPPCAWEQST